MEGTIWVKKFSSDEVRWRKEEQCKRTFVVKPGSKSA